MLVGPHARKDGEDRKNYKRERGCPVVSSSESEEGGGEMFLTWVGGKVRAGWKLSGRRREGRIVDREKRRSDKIYISQLT